MHIFAFTFIKAIFLKINVSKASALSSYVGQFATLAQLRGGTYNN